MRYLAAQDFFNHLKDFLVNQESVGYLHPLSSAQADQLIEELEDKEGFVAHCFQKGQRNGSLFSQRFGEVLQTSDKLLLEWQQARTKKHKGPQELKPVRVMVDKSTGAIWYLSDPDDQLIPFLA